jgi:hypothetical protein
MPSGSGATTLEGTWVRFPRDRFDDLVLVVEYTISLDHEVTGKLMFDCSEHFRLWLDGTYLLGGQPGQLFPSQHRPLPGRGANVTLARGTHRVRVTMLKPPTSRDHAEWVIALAEAPVLDWVPNAFRPDGTLDAS